MLSKVNPYSINALLNCGSTYRTRIADMHIFGVIVIDPYCVLKAFYWFVPNCLHSD